MIKNAVIYARYSSHSQREQSIEDQVNACKDFAERNDLIVVDVYADYAQTGTNDNREALQKMLADSNEKKFEIVLMWKLDRFSRNRYEAAMNRNILEKNGVKIVSITESIPDSAEGALVEGIMESLAEYYSRSLSQNVKRGHRSNAQKGLVNGGMTPLGYKVVDHKYVIDEESASIVRLIFNMYVNGYSKAEIADYLNDRGLRTSMDKNFTAQGITNIIKNKKYIGIYIYDDVVIEDAVPPIIDKETFEKANAIKRGYKRRSKDKYYQYLLSGKVYCGLCGAHYVGESGRSRSGKVYHYYKCANKKRKNGKCPSKALRADYLEEKALQVTLHMVLTENVIFELSERIKAISDKNDNEIADQLRSQLEDRQKSLDNLVKSIERGAFSDSIMNRINELETEVNLLKIKIEEEEYNSKPITQEEVADFLGGIKKELAASDIELSVILDKLIDSILVYENKIVINYRLSEQNGLNLDLSSNNHEMVQQFNHYSNFDIYDNIFCIAVNRD